jgi:hypothetical protein
MIPAQTGTPTTKWSPHAQWALTSSFKIKHRASRSLLRPLTPQNRLYRLKHNQQVKSKRHMLDVVQVELQLLAALSQGCPVAIAHLGPTRQPRPNHMP